MAALILLSLAFMAVLAIYLYGFWLVVLVGLGGAIVLCAVRLSIDPLKEAHKRDAKRPPFPFP